MLLRALGILALACPLPAQERAAAHLGELQAGVNAAIDRGVERLLALQNRDGSWGSDLREPVAHFDRRNGETGLAVYTLRKCRISADHPALQRAAAFLEGGFPTHNYSVSTQLLALDALGAPERWKDRMKELVDFLLSTRIRGEGTWGYPNHPGVYIDLSNTQYAALGLRAAAHSGLKIPKDVWLELVEGTLKYQQTPREIDVAASSGKSSTGKREVAGFGYMHGERESPSASMTAAGISILGIAKEGAGRDLPAPLGRSLERAQRLGLAWIEREFSVEDNPHGPYAWHYYWLYGLERVGALMQTERIGEHDWYRLGAARLVREQRDNGEWRTGAPVAWPVEPLPLSNTCFALLFLTKATAPSSGSDGGVQDAWASEPADRPVWLRAAGRARISCWISGFSPGTIEAYGHGQGTNAALHVDRVEFLVDGKLVETRDVDQLVPWKGERFSMQHAFETDGPHTMQARLHVALPTEVATEGHTTEVLESATLEVVARDVFQPWMLEYARAAASNKLEQTEVSARCSSQLASFTNAGAICDGYQGTGWAFAPTDTEPSITLELEKAQRAKLVILSQYDANRATAGELGRIRRVALYLNKDSTAIEFDLSGDALMKHELALPKPAVVRSLRLRVLAWDKGSLQPVGGFSEIELR
ncbi:MAG: hypothetical protein FJ294_05050 [Planctomycetes bacterium]|nr:hypothetical protein [Planctomycetota bacterium]